MDIRRIELDTKTLNELVQLRNYYFKQMEEAKDEIEGEYAFTLYCHIQQRIHELVNKYTVGEIS